MHLFDFFRGADYIAVALSFVLVALAVLWRPFLQPYFERLSTNATLCMLLLGVLPILLRLALLPHHPVPVPNLYDEFGHLLVADTLRHFRLANPPLPLPQFFETFFVLQSPTYSSIYPLGQGLVLALAWNLFGLPWAGVLVTTGVFCALCYWALRAWISPGWAFVAGLLAVAQFGPLNLWMNSYWGGSLTATAGCLVFGSLPRLTNRPRWRDAASLGMGLALHLLTRPFESVALVISVVLFFSVWRVPPKHLAVPAAFILCALGLTALQNRSVTGEWTLMPYQLSQQQYGVPAPLTFQTPPIPQRVLTPQQALDYKMQKAFQSSGPETLSTYGARLLLRVRYLRFFVFPPLYIALLLFFKTMRNARGIWIAATLLLFALLTNFFPAFQFHYVAAVACLFLLVMVRGLQWLHGRSELASHVLLLLCFAQFGFWYTVHALGDPAWLSPVLTYETGNNLNHQEGAARVQIREALARTRGSHLVFVRYWPNHIFQNEWVYNSADPLHSPILWARDLGPQENQRLLRLAPERNPWLLEPDALPEPLLTPYSAETNILQLLRVRAPLKLLTKKQKARISPGRRQNRTLAYRRRARVFVRVPPFGPVCVLVTVPPDRVTSEV